MLKDIYPKEGPTPGSGLFDALINDHISLGANLRLDNQTQFASDKTSNNFSIPEGNLYVEANFLNEMASLYFDQNYAPGGSSSREALIIIQNLPYNSYFKAGRMLIPFGLRILDDTSFIREITGVNYANQDLGVEFGFEPGPFSSIVSITNGTQAAPENNRQKEISTRTEWVMRNGRIGGSISWNKGDTATRTMYGGYAGTTFGRFTLLGEMDWLKDSDALGKVRQLMAFSELNFLIIRGMNFKVTYDFLDPNTAIGNNNRTRLRFGLETFITQFLQASLFYRFNTSIPLDTTGNADQFIFQIHAFF